MENLQPFANPTSTENPASGQFAEEKLVVEVVPASTLTPTPDPVLESPPLPVASPLESTHVPEAQDDLEVRLTAARVSRAKTFSKVTNLFHKIFAE